MESERTMQARIRCSVVALAAIAALGGCARGDYTTVRITYPPDVQGDQWPSKVSSRQRIFQSFWKVAEANGYKCRRHPKRVEEITCRGPRDMHITFRPTLNKPEFVATFNWLELGDRKPEEFERHIASFTSSLTRTANDSNVRLTVTAS
jgi:hypothetical protein